MSQEFDKVMEEEINKTESTHIDKPLSRVSFIEKPPISILPTNIKLEPILDTVQEIAEIDSADTVITIMDEIVNNVLDRLEQPEIQTVQPEIQTVPEEIKLDLEESKSFKSKFIKLYKKIKIKLSCFVKNI